MNIVPVINIFGNFGVSFFSPLIGGTIADTLYDTVSLTFLQSIHVAFWSAVLYTGLSISREAASWKRKEWKKSVNGDK